MQQNNLLVNPFLSFTLEDLLFEKQSVHQPIADNKDLSPMRRANAMNSLVLINQVLDLFTAAVQNDIDVEGKTGIQLMEEVYGKSVEDMAKEPGMLSKAGDAAVVAKDKAKGYLNKFAGWVAEKTK